MAINLSDLNLKKKEDNANIDFSELNLKRKEPINNIDLSDLNLKQKNTNSSIETAINPFKSIIDKIQQIIPETEQNAKKEQPEPVIREDIRQSRLSEKDKISQPILRAYTKADENNKTIYQPPDQFETLGDKINILSAGVKDNAELDKLRKKQTYAILSADLPVMALIGGMPLGIAAGIEGLKQIKNLIVQKTKGEKYNPLDVRGLSELLPENTNEYVKTAAGLVEALGDVALIGAGANKAKNILLEDAADQTIDKLKKAGYKINEEKINDFKQAIKEQSQKINIDDAAALNIQTRAAKIPKNIEMPEINTIKELPENTNININEERTLLKNAIDNIEILGRENLDKQTIKLLDQGKSYIKQNINEIKPIKTISNKLQIILNNITNAKYDMGEELRKEIFKQSYGTNIANKNINSIMKDMVSAEIPEWTLIKIPNRGEYKELPEAVKKTFFSQKATRSWDEIEELLERQGINTGLWDYLQQKYINANRIKKTGNYNIYASPETIKQNISIGTIKDDNFKLSQEVINILKKHIPKTLLAESSNRTRGTLGTYNRITNNIYIKTLNDITTAAHEAVHSIDFNNKYIETIKNSDYMQDLQNAYLNEYPTAKKTHPRSKQLKEGLAMVLQRAIEDPIETEMKYPTAFKMFQTNMQLKGFYEDASKLYQKYVSLDGPSKIKARISYENMKAPKETQKKTFLNINDKIKTQLLDERYPTYKLAEIAGVEQTAQNPYWLVKLNDTLDRVIIQNIEGKSEKYYSIRNNDLIKIYDFNWRTLYNKLKGKVKDFDALLAARRIYELDKLLNDLEADPAKIYNKDITDQIKELKNILQREGIKIEEATQTYREYQPLFIEEIKMYDQLRWADIEMLHNVHYINDTTYLKYKLNKGYAPFKREEFNEIIGEKNQTNNINKSTTVDSLKRYRGNAKNIISPLFSSIENHSQMMKAACKQAINNAIGDIADKLPGLLERVPVKTAIDNEGKIFFPQEKDKNILMARNKNGERIAFEMDADVRQAINDCFTIDNIGIAGQIPIIISKIFTIGTTGMYPLFALVNVLRDQPTAFVNSKNGYIPLTSSTIVLKDIFYNGPCKQYLREYIDLAGNRQTLLGSLNDPIKIEQKINHENKTLESYLTKSWGTVEKILSAPSNISEIVTRASEYCLARMNGKTIVESLEDAGRVSGSFHHIGKWGGTTGKIYVKSIPYFNAFTQVTARTGEAATDLKGKRFYKFALMTILTTIAYFYTNDNLWRKMDEEEKQDFQNLTAQQLALYLYFSSKKNNSMWKFPIAEQYSLIGNILTMITNEYKKRVNYNWKDYLQAVTTPIPNQFNLFEPKQLILSLIPQIGSIGISAVTKQKTYPEVMDIVPQYMQKMEPRMQYNEKTSALAKWAGNKLNISPIMIDYWLSSVFGRTVRLGLNIDNIGQFNPFEQKSYFTSGRIMNRFYQDREKYKGLKNSFKSGARELTQDEINWLTDNALKYDTKGISKLLSAYNKIARENRAKGIEELTPEQKNYRKQIFEIIFKEQGKNRVKQ